MISSAAKWIASHPYAVIVVIGLLMSFPLVMTGLPPASHDAIFHAFYLDNFAHQLSLGELYPRWLYRTNGGLGGPTFFYYQPGGSYLTYPFTFLPIDILRQLGVVSALGVIFSGCAAFLWLKEIASRGAALVGAIFVMLMPYPVGHDIYVRAAFGEALTFVWMPMILFFTVRICRGSRLSVIGVAVFYALMCTTHLPITLIFSPIPVLYVLIVHGEGKRLVSLAMTFGGIVLGAGLSAAYIIPAVAYENFAYLYELRAHTYSFAMWLMTTDLAIFGSMRYFWMTFEVAGVAIVCFALGFWAVSAVIRRELAFWLAIILGSIFMMLSISHPIWSAITYLQALQFPYRFNTLISIAALPLITFAISSVRRPLAAAGLIVTVLFGVYCLYDFMGVASAAYTPRPAWKVEFDAKMERLRLETHARWPLTAPNAGADLDTLLRQIPVTGDERAKAWVTAGTGNVSVSSWYPRRIELQVDAQTGATVNIAQFHYPGWQARLAASGDALPVMISQELGLVSITVPPGTHTVVVELGELWPEFIAEWISIGFGLLTLGLFVWLLYGRRGREKSF